MFWTIKQEISEDAERLWERMKDVRDLEAKMSHDGYLKLYQLRSVLQALSAQVNTSSVISSCQYIKLYQLRSVPQALSAQVSTSSSISSGQYLKLYQLWLAPQAPSALASTASFISSCQYLKSSCQYFKLYQLR